jgi:hypothetical protein
LRPVTICRDVDSIDPCLLRPARYLRCLSIVDGRLNAVLGCIYAAPERVIRAYCGSTGTNYLEQEPSAVFQTAPILVSSLVEAGTEKLSQQVAISAVDFYAVKPGLLRPHRRLSVALYQLFYLGNREFLDRFSSLRE